LPDDTDRDVPPLGLDRLSRSVGRAIEDHNDIKIVAKFRRVTDLLVEAPEQPEDRISPLVGRNGDRHLR